MMTHTVNVTGRPYVSHRGVCYILLCHVMLCQENAIDMTVRKMKIKYLILLIKMLLSNFKI